MVSRAATRCYRPGLNPVAVFSSPEWNYTDEEGYAEYTYTPNAAGPYDLQEDTIAHVIDINVGRLFEVDKHYRIQIPIEAPLTTD